MQHLEKTQAAVAELAVNQNMMFGMHRGSQLKAGVQGKAIADVPYNPEVHEDPMMINPMSVWEDITGEKHVTEVIPNRPLKVSVVMHCDPEQGSDPVEIANGRKLLMDGVFKSLKESLLFGDTSRIFIAGRKDPDLMDSRAKYLEGTEEPLAAAKAIGRVCTNGLTVVLSTFKNLPLEQLDSRGFKDTIGIKANHVWDRKLGSNIGPWDTGEEDPTLRSVNTNDARFRLGKGPTQLERYHEVQQKRHEGTVARMEQAGIKMAEAIFDKQVKPYWFDLEAIDGSVASAIRRIDER